MYDRVVQANQATSHFGIRLCLCAHCDACLFQSECIYADAITRVSPRVALPKQKCLALHITGWLAGEAPVCCIR